MILGFIVAMEDEGEDMDSSTMIENEEEDLPDKQGSW